MQEENILSYEQPYGHNNESDPLHRQAGYNFFLYSEVRSLFLRSDS